MFQVAFRDVIPTPQLAGQVSAAYAALRAPEAAHSSEDVCLRVTLSHRDAPSALLYVAVVELVNAAGAVTRAETSGHQLGFALRSALSVISAGPSAGLVQRECERRDKLQALVAQHDTSPILACVGA